MDDEPSWAIDELVARAELALTGASAAGGYPGAPNGRVREVPDQRAVRWYASIGLVDRPVGGRGRGARYGLRHLRQLVAVKLLQAQGLALADIQGRLAGIADDDLARLAPLPATVAAAPEVIAPQRFWAAPSPRLQVTEPAVAAPAPVPAPESFVGVRLTAGVLLALSRAPSEAELAAIGEAARPLVACLFERGLVSTATPVGPVEGAPR